MFLFLVNANTSMFFSLASNIEVFVSNKNSKKEAIKEFLDQEDLSPIFEEFERLKPPRRLFEEEKAEYLNLRERLKNVVEEKDLLDEEEYRNVLEEHQEDWIRYLELMAEAQQDIFEIREI